MEAAQNLISTSKQYFAPEKPDIWIGKDVLELIAGGMYTNPLSMLREYIQNAVDSIDAAYACDLIAFEDHRVDIKIDKARRSIKIRDNGAGIAKDDFVQTMLSIGGSQKRGSTQRGFRGVGRFAALSYCREVRFRSSVIGEDTVSEIKWDGVKFKSALRTNEKDYDLTRIINEICEISLIESCEPGKHFFEVEIKGIVRLQNDKLLNPKLVYDYLSQVAPIPFPDGFSHSGKINKYLDQYDHINDQYNIFLTVDEECEQEQVLKPYVDEFEVSKEISDIFDEIQFVEFDNLDGELSVIGWIAHSSYYGALPRGSLFKGIRVRDGNVQIGDASLLTGLFKQQRFNSWSVGELHVLNKSLTPTARRDEFETDGKYADFQNKFANFSNSIETRCRAASAYRNFRKVIEASFQDLDSDLAILKQGSVSDSKVSLIVESASIKKDKLKGELNKVDALDEDYRKLWNRYNSRDQKLSALKENGFSEADFYTGMTKPKKQIYTEIFDLLHKHMKDSVEAKNLINKLMGEISLPK